MLSFDRWSALVASSLLPYGAVPVSGEEETWQDWATAVRSLPKIAALKVPSPESFPDWQSWGFRLNEALLTIGL